MNKIKQNTEWWISRWEWYRWWKWDSMSVSFHFLLFIEEQWTEKEKQQQEV